MFFRCAGTLSRSVLKDCLEQPRRTEIPTQADFSDIKHLRVFWAAHEVLDIWWRLAFGGRESNKFGIRSFFRSG